MTGGDLWFFDRIAPLYDQFMVSADADTLSAGLALADRDVTRVVDVAGGTGRAISALDVGERLLVDASRPMLRRAAARGIPSVLGDAGRLPLADESVDAVVIADALHHLPEPDRALTDVVRVLAPGGVLVVQEFDPTTLRGRAIEFFEGVVQFKSTFYTPRELEAKFQTAGLSPSVVARGWSYVIAGVKPH